MTADDAVRGDRFAGIDSLERFSRLIERGKTVLDAGCGDGLPVDGYLVKEGFAVNGIDVSADLIERARKNVPEAFYEVKDLVNLQDGEYCVDGVVSLHAMFHIPRGHYRALLQSFLSFMPGGGALLLGMPLVGPDQNDDTDVYTELLEDTGFTVILNEIQVPGDEKRQIILARS